MGQIIDNLNNINKLQPNDAFGTNKKTSFQEDMSKGISESDRDSLLGYKFTKEKKEGYLENTTMKNFEEYLKNRQEKARQAGQDAASEEKKEKENEKEITRSLSAEEIKKLKIMGIDVEGASMSDLLGMVNTMRHNEHKDEQMELMAGIALSDGDTDNMTIIGGTVKTGGVKIDVDVSDIALADEKKVTDADMAEDFCFEENEIIYLLHNELPVNEDNLYKAHFSGTKIDETGITNKAFEEMKPQIERVIEQAGLSVSEETVEEAKLLINNDIPVTTDNIRRYEELKEYVGKDASEVLNAAVREDEEVPAQKLISDISLISPDFVYEMAKEDKEVTIASATRELSKRGFNLDIKDNVDRVPDNDEKQSYTALSVYEKDLENGTLEKKAVTARRQMEEIRLSMTMEAAMRMTSLDVNVDTRELSRFVNMLRDVEKRMLSDTFKNAGVEPTNENILTYNEFMGKVNEIKNAPAEILAAPLSEKSEFTVNSLYMRAVATNAEYAMRASTVSEPNTDIKASGQTNEARFETVVRSYEAVGTAPRYDMGDSIRKAFANVNDILESMDMPVNDETERAVRILGYNRIEITEANITEVVNYDRQVNELISNLYPEAVLGMIKENINPLDTDIEDLNKKLRDRRYNEGVTEAEDFASYLRDMEAKGEVSPEERASYIGIYRMMDKLAKSGDREAGWLFANSSRLTVRNLLSAMRSRKNAGVDVSVDDAFGALSDINVKGSRIDEQIERAFKEKPDVAPFEEESVAEDIESFNELGEEVTEFIRENNIELSMVNAFAVDNMINTPGGIYRLVYELLADMKFDTGEKDKLIDGETENMTDSMLGEDIDIDLSQFEMDSILESLRGSEEMSQKYDDLRNQITEMMYRMGASGRLGSKELASVKTINAGFNIMSRMAKRENFRIPVRTEEGINVINLSIEHDSENKGSININMPTKKLDNISCQIRVTQQKALYGHIISDTSDGNNMLMSLSEEFGRFLTDRGYETTGISLGRLKEITLFDGEAFDASERTLYETAVSLVRGLADISG
ncbi:MAG: hypothetical protein IJ141_10485 [Lachnospiraceae bacterium]|nr:hypothetical protein [Lachnospiraceae bacterium]